MSTIVLLIRHGQTASNVTNRYAGRSDENLTKLGYSHARFLSSRLATRTIESVYSSPLRRANTTALTIAGPHSLEVQVLDDLTEIGLGDWEGLHADEIRRRWPSLWRRFRINPSGITFPNGESYQDAAKRAVRAFNTVVMNSHGRQVVIVTHEVVIKSLVAYALGTPNSIYRRFEIDLASLTTLRVTDDRVTLAALNETAHLD